MNMTLENITLKKEHLLVKAETAKPKIQILNKDFEPKAVVKNIGRIEKMGSPSPLFKEGDQVVFPAYAGTEIVFGGIDYLLMTKDCIIALVE